MDVILDNITKRFGGVTVLDGVSAVIGEGSLTCVTGPSGCGKTTLLRIVAGLETPDAGTVTGTSGVRMAFAFQEPRLLPWKSVIDNVQLVMPEDMPAGEKRESALRFLEMTGMERWAGAFPGHLSGGMSQRVSLSRALAADADLLLLDEPFSSVDAPLRESVMIRLKAYLGGKGTTVIMVTHSECGKEFSGWSPDGFITLRSR